MIDLRERIILLAEKCLHLFIEERINVLQVNGLWRKWAKDYEEKEYSNSSHRGNVESLHLFFENHSIDELQIRNLDITAMSALLLFDKNGFENLTKLKMDDKARGSFISCFHDFRNIRNYIRHFTSEIPEQLHNEFIISQFEAASGVVRFIVFCEKHHIGETDWKYLLIKALRLQDELRREKWFLHARIDNHDLSPENDFSDILYAAEEGDQYAQVLLGKMYSEGRRVKGDPVRALIWFLKAAQENNIEALYFVGKYYNLAFFGLDDDYSKSREWIKKSADLGYAPAQYEVALSYKDYGITEGDKIGYLEKSSAQNYSSSIFKLALCYYLGEGVNKNIKKGIELAIQAAEIGDVSACEFLAEVYAGECDNKMSIYWYKEAERLGSHKAAAALKRMS